MDFIGSATSVKLQGVVISSKWCASDYDREFSLEDCEFAGIGLLLVGMDSLEILYNLFSFNKKISFPLKKTNVFLFPSFHLYLYKWEAKKRMVGEK